MNTLSSHQVSRQGMDALRSGQFEAARSAFAHLQQQGLADADDLTALALACARLNDTAAAHQAVDAALAKQPGHLRALIFKADLHAQAGSDREAAAAYQLATRAAPDWQGLPHALQRDARRAHEAVAHYAAKFAAELEAGLENTLQVARQAHGAAATRRFERGIGLLLGRQDLYRSQPRLFYLPGLPEQPCFEREAFPWLGALEAQTAAIRMELQGLLRNSETRFKPYVERVPGRAVLREGGMLGSTDWTACYLWKNGHPVPEVQAQCPQTVAALGQVPLVLVPGRAPNVLFSLLQPGAHIPPHHGFLNTRCIVHLPLIVPASEPPCRLRVGAETEAWREGRAIVFDDSFEHEAWNPSEQLRVVLLFEVWRPELSALERDLMQALFKALPPTDTSL